jgi:hypothetical protein
MESMRKKLKTLRKEDIETLEELFGPNVVIEPIRPSAEVRKGTPMNPITTREPNMEVSELNDKQCAVADMLLNIATAYSELDQSGQSKVMRRWQMLLLFTDHEAREFRNWIRRINKEQRCPPEKQKRQ